MRTAAAIAIAALAAAAARVAAAGAAAPAAAAPVVNAHLDVAAVDLRGRPVRGLGPSDFELIVAGAPQPLDNVVAVDPASTPRPLAIFLDEYHVTPDEAGRVRVALAQFVDSSLRPTDPVIVMKPLDSTVAIPVAKDLAEVRRAIDSFTGRAGDYEPRTPFEREFMARSPEIVDRLRRQVTVSGLNALATRLGGLGDGRKSILLVSDGFKEVRQTRGEEELPTVGSLVRNANRDNVAIYTLNPSGGAGAHELLRTIATETDGRAAAYDDRVESALQKIASDSSSYYLLTWRPAVAADGRFYPLEVRVRRPGVRVRTRKGFWAMAPDEAVLLARPDPEAEAASVFERTPRHRSPLITPWIGMSRGDEGRTRITLVWEPAPSVPGERLRAVAPALISVKAIGRDGSAIFEGAVRPTGATDELENAAAKATFDVPPGRFLLEMSIAGANARQLDTDVRDVAVRDLAAPVAIGTPQILRARTARQLRVLAADPDAAPVAAREFSRAERLLVRFPAYVPAGDAAVVSARLVSRAGATMRSFAPVELAGAPGVRQIDMPLAGFAPGDYTLEIAVSAHAGTAKELVGFRVTG